MFLDRDGVLVRDPHLLVRPEQLELLPGAARAALDLRQAGFDLIVVTNQPVVARGMISELDVVAIHDRLDRLLVAAGGCVIDRFYFCPHHPRADLEEYRKECHCRKPRPGMLLRARDELSIRLDASFLVGDRPSDVAAGAAAGCRTILVETGMHEEPPIESPDVAPAAAPDLVCASLAEAAEIILGRAALGTDVAP